MEYVHPAYLAAGGAAVAVYLTTKTVRYYTKKEEVKKKIAQIRERAAKNFDLLEQQLLSDQNELLNEKRQEIVDLPIEALLKKLENGDLTCLQVLQAYQAKALRVTRELNCVTEFIMEAETWAKQLDSEAEQTGKRGPLHGLPFSVKENISIAGYDCTIGITKFIGQPVPDDAAMVKALKKLGAIPFCKTNIPQTMLSFGCSNPVWGLTKNPCNKDRTPGGSTGGEGCLIAAGASPFGIGSDVGGSARLPAAFCGIPSLKPTSRRFTLEGFKKAGVSCVGVESVPGLLARDVFTVELVAKLLLKDSYLLKNGDPNILPIPWNDEIVKADRKMRIGYYEDDGFFPATPGVRRAVRLAKEKLEAAGHELIEIAPPRVDHAVGAVVSMLSADGCKFLLEAIAYDDVDPLLKVMMFSVKIPYFVKRILRPVVGFFASRLVPVFMGVGGHSLSRTHQLWYQMLQLSEYKEEFLSLWRNANLDLCIAPCFPCPAPRAEHVGNVVPAFSYTCLYNYLDFPAGVLPVTKENEDDQARLETEYNYKDKVCETIKKTSKGALGMPIALQVVGLPFQEELILHGMEVLRNALRSEAATA